MKFIKFVLLIGVLLGGAVWRMTSSPTARMHDPIGYYKGWSGYRHPVALTDRITRDEAETLAAAGVAYLIGTFDAEGRIVHVVKMLHGAVFFDYAYAYHPDGTLKRALVTSADGRVSTLRYDARGRLIKA